jgi:hypothetical protein
MLRIVLAFALIERPGFRQDSRLRPRRFGWEIRAEEPDLARMGGLLRDHYRRAVVDRFPALRSQREGRGQCAAEAGTDAADAAESAEGASSSGGSS